jgi:hypothetical protein
MTIRHPLFVYCLDLFQDASGAPAQKVNDPLRRVE